MAGAIFRIHVKPFARRNCVVHDDEFTIFRGDCVYNVSNPHIYFGLTFGLIQVLCCFFRYIRLKRKHVSATSTKRRPF